MPPSRTVPRGQRVLVVDDDPIMVRTLRRLIRRAHPEWEVVSAASGVEALAVLERMSVDVMVTDLVMPDMGGEVLLGNVRVAHPCTIRVIYSGELDEEKLHPAEDLAHLVLVKPAPAEAITETLDAAMSLATMGGRCASKP